MKQRVMIAMALALEPDVLIADEPTTALDLTIQAQVLRLLKDMQRRRGTAMVLITHDLGVVGEVADWVAVMYAGHLVEVAPAQAFFRGPRHPYSQKLFAALPSAGKRDRALAVIPGQVPSLARAWRECRFADRCEFVLPACRNGEPGLDAVAPEHRVRCIRAGEPPVRAAADAVAALEEPTVPTLPPRAPGTGGRRRSRSRVKLGSAPVTLEDGLLHVLRSKGTAILEDIRKTGDLTDATADKLKATVTEFAKSLA